MSIPFVFQEAAGVYMRLREEASKLDATIQDMSPDSLTALELVLLAQVKRRLQFCLYS